MSEEPETVSLYLEGGFPAAVAHTDVGVPNIAKMAARKLGDKYDFAINRQNTAAALRRLADDVDAGRVLPQSMVDATTAKVDDFVLRAVTFTFAEVHEDVAAG